MTATESELNALSVQLKTRGIAGFCPTTLSTPWNDFLPVVRRLGQWIRSGKAQGARPLGLHLEGPYLSSNACGAHPPEALRPFSLQEVETLWNESENTLKILTIAPELLSDEALKSLVKWAKPKKIHLSAGHSRATESQARAAFRAGFRGVTHAWNAMGFHQREPGILGAALGDPDVFVEVIPDFAHVSPTVLNWTRSLHSNCCLVSDCISAGATDGQKTYRFGPLQVQAKDGASRTADGHLAGGALLLPESLCQYLHHEARRMPQSVQKQFASMMDQSTKIPLKALQLAPGLIQSLLKPQIDWKFHAGSQNIRVSFEVRTPRNSKKTAR